MSVFNALSLSRRAALGFVAMGVFFGSFAALVPVLKARIGADDALFGLVLLGSPLGLLATLWVAPVFDRHFGRMSLPLAALALVAAFVLPALAAGPVVFFVAMIGLGLAAGLLDIVSNTRVSELEAATRTSLMNANHGMFSVAYALSAVLTGALREASWSPAAIFAVMAVAVFAMAPAMRMEVAPAASAEDRRAVGLPGLVVGLCGGIVLVAFFVEAVVESWSALHIERTLGGSAAEGALGPAVLGLTMAFGRLSGQAVTGRVADITIIGWGSGLAFLGAVLAAIAWGPVPAYLGFALMGLGVSVVGPLALALVGRIVPPAHRASAIARANTIGFGAFLLAPLVMGQISDSYGLRAAFAAVGGLALIAPLLALMLARRAS